MDESRREILRKTGFLAAAGGLGGLTAFLAAKSGPPSPCGACQMPDAKCQIWKAQGSCPRNKK